jgi:hypothetical protein
MQSMAADRFDALLVALTAAPSRRAALRVLAGVGLAGLVGHTAAKKKKKKKKCSKAGQTTSKKRKKCCSGLTKDGTGVCAACILATCPPNACGSLPDGCGGTLTCGCPAEHLCLRGGVCQRCNVTCDSGNPVICGAWLQTVLNLGEILYVCPGVYRGGFTLDNAVTVIGAGAGADAASNTILDGNRTQRVLRINADIGPVALERLRITGGFSGSGSGISHLGAKLEMTECTVGDSTGSSAIYAAGTTTAPGITTLTDCLIEDNSTADDGGGLYLFKGTATLAGNTQVRGNTAKRGGGIAVNFTSTLEIAETCRVTGNTAAAAGDGGGIFNDQGIVTLAGADPSPIVVNNCEENCAAAGVSSVPKCSAVPPISCPP